MELYSNYRCSSNMKIGRYVYSHFQVRKTVKQWRHVETSGHSMAWVTSLVLLSNTHKLNQNMRKHWTNLIIVYKSKDNISSIFCAIHNATVTDMKLLNRIYIINIFSITFLSLQSTKQCIKLWFVAFSDFCGVHTPPMADFKPPSSLRSPAFYIVSILVSRYKKPQKYRNSKMCLNN